MGMKLEIAAVVCGLLLQVFVVVGSEVMATLAFVATVALMIAGLVT